jgi:hypothetical protein
MARQLNSAGMAFARSLIRAGKTSDASWSFSGDDGNALLGSGGDNWANFGKHHLAENTDANEETKDRYSYPFAKDDTLYESALRAIRSRSSQQGDKSIFEAAGKLMDMVEKSEGDTGSDDSDDKSIRRVSFSGIELKFIDGLDGDAHASDCGTLAGYASVFNIPDFYGDVIAPGAFDDTLAEQKAAGRVMPMYGEHSFSLIGGDPYPIGMWTDVTPDDKGLKVKGKLIGLQHPDVSRVHELVKAGIIPGISIAYRVRPNGAVIGKKAGEPKRLLKSIDLHSIDLVGDPANPGARIESVKAIKAILKTPNADNASAEILACASMCQDCMSGGDAPTMAERQAIMGHLNNAYLALNGEPMPGGAFKNRPETVRQFERFLREQGYSHAEARSIAERGFKSASTPRDGDDATAMAALRDLRGALSGFSLPRIGE